MSTFVNVVNLFCLKYMRYSDQVIPVNDEQRESKNGPLWDTTNKLHPTSSPSFYILKLFPVSKRKPFVVPSTEAIIL